MQPSDARALWQGLEPYHAMIYFAPEGFEEYTAIGLEGMGQGYFAARAAAMGAVPAEVVTATFYNFHPALVASSIPDAWDIASPATVLSARYRAVDRALRRLLPEDALTGPDLAEAAALARTASEGCTTPGRPLYAAHASLPWPDEPHVALWHAIALLREFRGDGHIAAMVVQEMGPLTAIVLHGATGEFPVQLLKLTRAWPEPEWDAEVSRLQALDWLDADEQLTDTGTAARQALEDATDRAALAPWEHLGAEGCARLLEVGRPLAMAIVDAGGAGFLTRD